MSVTPGAGLRQRPAELAVRPARGRRVPRLGRPCLRRRSAGSPAPSRSASTPTTTTSPGLPLESPTAMVQIRMSSGAIAQVLLSLRDRPVGVRDPAEQPVPDRRHGGLDLLGPRPGRARTPATATIQTWELPSWTLPDFKPRDPRRDRQHGPPDRRLHRVAPCRRRRRRSRGEDGRAAIEMTQAAKLSAQTGRAVDLPLDRLPRRDLTREDHRRPDDAAARARPARRRRRRADLARAARPDRHRCRRLRPGRGRQLHAATARRSPTPASG